MGNKHRHDVGIVCSRARNCAIASPRYLESVWCRREFEITQYLVERGDYMEQRWVMDVEQPNLAVLDGLLAGDDAPTLLNTFPPLCQVWAPTPLPEWETKMLRAAAALRLMNVFLGNADLANRLAGMLAGGLELPGTAPTNNPTGWQAYAKIFAELRALTPGDSEQFPLRLPADYGEEERRKDTEWSLRIEDLSKGTPALADILVALEWYRVEWPAMLEQNRGDLFLIDCQRLTIKQWSTHGQVSLLRGLAAIRTTVPMWFLQLAGQEVENWPMVGERPIFTEHVSNQFAWLMAAWFERGEAQALYPAASGLQFSKELAAMCGSQGSAPA